MSTARGQREGEGLWREKRLRTRLGPSEDPPLQLPGGLVKTQAARLHPRSLCFSRSESGPTVCLSSHSHCQLHSFEIHLPLPWDTPQAEPRAQEHENRGASLCQHRGLPRVMGTDEAGGCPVVSCPRTTRHICFPPEVGTQWKRDVKSPTKQGPVKVGPHQADSPETRWTSPAGLHAACRWLWMPAGGWVEKG